MLNIFLCHQHSSKRVFKDCITLSGVNLQFLKANCFGIEVVSKTVLTSNFVMNFADTDLCFLQLFFEAKDHEFE